METERRNEVGAVPVILQEYPDHNLHLLRLQQQNHGSTLIQKQG